MSNPKEEWPDTVELFYRRVPLVVKSCHYGKILEKISISYIIEYLPLEEGVIEISLFGFRKTIGKIQNLILGGKHSNLLFTWRCFRSNFRLLSVFPQYLYQKDTVSTSQAAKSTSFKIITSQHNHLFLFLVCHTY